MESEQNSKEGGQKLIKILSFVVKKHNEIKKNNKSIALWLVIVSFGLIFGDYIANFLAKLTYLDKEEASSVLFNIIYSFCIIIILGRFCWYFIINYRMSQTYIYWIISINIIYILKIRNNDSSLLVLLPFINKFLYSDIILIIGCLTIFLLIRNQFGHLPHYYKLLKQIRKHSIVNKKDFNSSYLQDLALDGEQAHELDILADELIKNIIDFKPSQAFVIAIKAPWGYGKTTFLRRLEHKINYGENKIPPIIFWFNTWNSQDEKSIVNNFFSLFKKELAVYNGNIESAINKYIGKILSIIYAKEIRILKTFTDDIVGEKGSIEEYYLKIENILNNLDRQIIVIVDDLDRLNKNEILEAMRVLRNIANFKNVIFICGIDKEYLVKSAQFESNYLDKIFNLEVDLPILGGSNLFLQLKQIISECDSIKNISTNSSLDKISLNEKINKELDKIFNVDESLIDLVDLGMLEDQTITNTQTTKLEELTLFPTLFFKTRRDIKRFYNYLMTNILILKKYDDIDLQDYLLFHILLFKYSWIRVNFENNNIKIWMIGEINLIFTELQFEKLNFPDNLTYLDKNIIFTVLCKLFPKTGLKEGKGINQKRYFPIYLDNNIFNEAFSYLELIKSLNDNTIEELILTLQNKPHKNFLLNDIKGFILKDENLSNIDLYKNAISLLNKKYFTTISDTELLNFINYGETHYFNDMHDIADNNMFLDTDNVFGDLILRLNFHYATFPYNEGIHNSNSDAFENFFNRRQPLQEFKVINKDYVRYKLLQFIRDKIDNDCSYSEINKVLSWSVEYSFKFFNFYYYPKTIAMLMQDYFKQNFSDLYLEGKAENVSQRIPLDYLVQFFVDESEKKFLYDEVNKIIKLDRFNSRDLNTSKFAKNGLENFKFFLKQQIQPKEAKKEQLFKLVEYINNEIKLNDLSTIK
jgi:hypothetical protein